MRPRFKRHYGADGARPGDCIPLAPECRQPGISKPVSLMVLMPLRTVQTDVNLRRKRRTGASDELTRSQSW